MKDITQKRLLLISVLDIDMLYSSILTYKILIN